MISTVHKRFNDVLFIADILIALFLVSYPFIPEISYRANPVVAPISKNIISVLPFVQERPESDFERQLIIHKIGVDAHIITSEDVNDLDFGVWHQTVNRDPEQGGNMVLAGHRFQYTSGSNTFYHLDKLAVGDEIQVHWNNVEYTYIVDDISVVEPNENSVLSNTDSHGLTLYTCTPLWTAENRLVVRAHLEDV